MNGGVNIWAITPEERTKHDRQFDSLTPTLGYVSGEQARKFFLQSGLPASVLAEIWSLADMTSDGRMDRLEFSIAMKLIKLQLQGQPLPSALPAVMKQTPAPSIMTSSTRFGMGSMPNLSLMPTSSANMMPSNATCNANATAPAAPTLLPLPLGGLAPPNALGCPPLLRGMGVGVGLGLGLGGGGGGIPVPVPVSVPMMPTSLSNPALPNGGVEGLGLGLGLGYGGGGGNGSILAPSSVAGTTGLSTSTSFPSGASLSKARSLLDLGSSSSNSSSTTSLASISPKKGSSDWAVPQASRLKYRQQFNSLDKLMSGYLSGPQVRTTLTASNLTQTQLATIWNLADVDQDGQLQADEFILALHLVDLAKTGQPLPLSLPPELVPPSFRSSGKSGEMVNGTGPPPCPAAELLEPEMPIKTKTSTSVASLEDRKKENFQRGSAELEKRRLALQEEARREEERREEVRREEARQRQLREARHQEALRAQEQERRRQRERELERQREEERRREEQRIEAERQELQRRRQQEQEEISRLKARKRTLQLELEAVGNKHKQISDCLRDARSKRQIQRAELELVNQRRDGKIAEISSLQSQLEDFQRQLSQLIPEQQQLKEKLRTIGLNKSNSSAVSSVKSSVSVKQLGCRKLKEQLDALERETTAKLSEMDQHHRDLKDLREKQTKQQGVLDGLVRVKEEKVRELQWRKKELEEKRRREEEEAARRAQLELELQQQEEERQRQRQLQQEKEAQQREQEQIEAQARLQKAQEQAQEEERSRRREREEKEEQERMRREEEEQKRKEEEEEEAAVAAEVESEAVARQQDVLLLGTGVAEDLQAQLSALFKGVDDNAEVKPPPRRCTFLTPYRALYPFAARNGDELTLEAGVIVEVNEGTVGEPGWFYGSCQGRLGWFPQSYVEKCSSSGLAGEEAAATEPPPVNTHHAWATDAANTTPPGPGAESLGGAIQDEDPTSGGATRLEETQTSTSPLSSSFSDTPDATHTPEQVRALCSWTAKSEGHLSFSQGDIISVLQRQETWWLGELNGTQGWFPKTYVTLPVGEGTSDQLQSAADESDFSDGCQLEEFVALYTYESPEAGDLTFRVGDSILVTEREGEWWKGCIGDHTGVFPSNYVKPKDTCANKPGATTKKPEIVQVTGVSEATTPEQLSLSPGQLILVLAKNSSGWWLGELQARGKKRQRGWFPSANIKVLGTNSGKSTPAPQPICQVIAMYDYKAANEDEMSFSKGQLISVLNQDNADWWKGESNGATGLFPTNYVKMTTETDPSQQWCADLMSLESMSAPERKRQGYIHELIQTEERYLEDLELVLEVFHKPMAESGRLTEAEMGVIFINWRELIMCNTKLLKALRVRKKLGGENMPVQLIGDILASELGHMQAYIRFCSCQLNSAALLQNKTDNTPDFKDFLKKIATNYRCKGMPLSSFLLKPMQRITRYPLLIKNILENTPEGHGDQSALRDALEKAEELCLQVNEGVREKENSDRLEWIQNHVQCDGIIEHLVFNSLTNCLGPRKLLHSGRLHKSKSSKELWAFLFSDFLLLTSTSKPFSASSSSSSSAAEKLFGAKSNAQYKMYKTPVFLNEVLVKMPSDPSSDEPLFHISHIDRVYTLKADSINERTTWVQRIKGASEHFIETEKKKREKAYQARSLKTSGIGRLLVTVQEASELKSCKPNGKSNPYCELTMGAQCYTSKAISDTLNPKWNFSCHFFIKDLYQDVLCITVFERDQFSPDDFLGRTEVPVATIKKDQEVKGPANRRLLLHEVSTGEVWVRLDLQLYDPVTHK
ncbi:intersectin-2a [Engraulis encrasicolus]|uniref:intersectin-2a n=1 Tax=Engraulis encrasicolus TaxID=184585 RepID=UPI002FCF1987